MWHRRGPARAQNSQQVRRLTRRSLPRSSVHERDLARFQAAGRRKISVRRPLLFDPGERWLYGTSTDVVGKLVEKAFGQKLVRIARDP